MNADREIAFGDLKALAIGTGVLGAGGGTHPYLELLNIERLYGQGYRVQLLDPASMKDDETVAEVGYMGAPLVSKERLPDPKQICKAFRLMERHTGQRFGAVMSSEIGGENGILPLAVAALMGIPLVDADPRGRAFPEMQMSSFAIAGLPLFPIALADVRDNEILLTRTASPLWTERLGRRLCTETGSTLATCRTPRSGRQIKDHAVLGSVSRAIGLGRAVLDARAAHTDPAEAVLGDQAGQRLFTGKVIDVVRRTTGGFVRGTASVAGLDADQGSVFDVAFQNEFTLGWRDGELVVMVPDLITLLDSISGEAVGTETMRYGLRVTIVSLPAADVLTTPAALEIVGPRAFGYDLDFASVHSRTPDEGTT